jgi:Glu-tRNA(Gln) amidotransferase subunit E-like FAD-binding protein
MKRLKKKRLNTDVLSDEIILKIFDAYRTGKIIKDGIYFAFEKSLVTGLFTKEALLKPAKTDDVKDFASKALSDLKNMTVRKPENIGKILMGVMMNKFRGRIAGSQAMSIVGELIGGEV